MKLIDDIGNALEEILKEINFDCLKCGECCKVKSGNINSIQYHVRTIWKGEGSKLPSEGWEIVSEKIKLSDMWDGRLRIVEKNGMHTCFFYNFNNKNCEVYENRPILCRGHPIFILATGDMGFNDKCKWVIKSNISIRDITLCKGFIELLHLVGKLKDLIL